MKKVISLFLALTFAFSLVACAKTDTSATPTTPSTQPTTPSTQPSKPITPPDDTPLPGDNPVVPDAETQNTINDLIRGYTWYMAVGLCCQFEHDDRDLSAHLTDSQKQNYFNQQYRITCCHTPQEFQAHIDRTLAKELQVRSDVADRLFTDDEGILYLIVIPTGYVDYRDVTIRQSDGHLYAKAGAYDEDGWFADAYFTIQEQNENLIITQVARTDHDEVPSFAKDLFQAQA